MQPGDEVILPVNTYIATIRAIAYNNLVPILVDPKLITLEIDDDLIEAAVTPKAIAIVHFYGRCTYPIRFATSARSKYNIKLVENCAQSHGRIGAAADHSCYPDKSLGDLGDSVAMTTSDLELASTFRILANYGNQKKYVFKNAGRNSRLDEIQAAL